MSISKIELVLDRLLRQFGGVDNLTAAWADNVRRARPSAMTLKTFASVARLIEIVDARRPPEVSAEELSDQQLEDELRQMIEDLVEGRPLV